MILNQEIAISYFERMAIIRYTEESLAKAWDKGLVPGVLHLASGHEAVSVGIACQLDNTIDKVTASHRGHGAAIAMGVPLKALIAEVLGRDGLNGGFGGTQHIAAPKYGFLTANGIVGGQVPLAAGAALTAKITKSGGIAVSFMGDAAINQGSVLETLNLAKILSLPHLFVVEDNGLGATIGNSYSTAGKIESRAAATGMSVFSVDGADIVAVVDAAQQAIASIRSGHGPAMIVARVKRLEGHYYGDDQSYRNPDEIRDAKEHFDPIERLAAVMLTMGWQQNERDMMEQKVKSTVDRALKEAFKYPLAETSNIETGVYGSELS